MLLDLSRHLRSEVSTVLVCADVGIGFIALLVRLKSSKVALTDLGGILRLVAKGEGF